MILNLILIGVLLIIAGISKSIMDTIQFRYKNSIFTNFKKQKWWNPSISWRNKYRRREKENGPKFIGSTTFLVFLTDAWHFFQFILLSALSFAILLGINISVPFLWYHWILGWFISMFVIGAVFELFWSKILVK